MSAKARCLERRAYPVHLALDQWIDLLTRLLLPHEAEGVPVCLEGTDRTEAFLSLPQKPVPEGVQDIDGDGFEGGPGVFLGKSAVSGAINQTPTGPSGQIEEGDSLIPIPLDQAQHVFAALSVDSLSEFQDVQVLFQLLVVFRRMLHGVCRNFTVLSESGVGRRGRVISRRGSEAGAMKVAVWGKNLCN